MLTVLEKHTGKTKCILDKIQGLINPLLVKREGKPKPQSEFSNSEETEIKF